MENLVWFLATELVGVIKWWRGENDRPTTAEGLAELLSGEYGRIAGNAGELRHVTQRDHKDGDPWLLKWSPLDGTTQSKSAAQSLVDEGWAESFTVEGNSGLAARRFCLMKWTPAAIETLSLPTFQSIEGEWKYQGVAEVKVLRPVVLQRARDLRKAFACLRFQTWVLEQVAEGEVRELHESEAPTSWQSMPSGVVEFSRRTTSCSNVRAVVGRPDPSGRIRVSKSLMSLVIGRGGENIKKAGQAFGRRIIAVEV